MNRRPGLAGTRLQALPLSLSLDNGGRRRIAYERLLLDVLIGDPPLFPRQAEVELSWRILDPVEDFWASYTKPEQYPAWTAGPPSADALMARDGRAWRRL